MNVDSSQQWVEAFNVAYVYYVHGLDRIESTQQEGRSYIYNIRNSTITLSWPGSGIECSDSAVA